MAASQRQPADRLPFFHYWRHCQTGWAERECRNRGMGINWVRPCYTEQLHEVEINERPITVGDRTVWRRTYTTPVGCLTTAEFREPGTGQWKANRSWKGQVPWTTERLIKQPQDYAVARYLVEHTEYVADYAPIEQAMQWLGEEGVVMAGLPHSPMQMLMINWVGSEDGRFFYHLADCPELVEDLYRVLCRKREAAIEIAAKSPAPIVLCGDNVDGVLVSPPLFQKYFVPVYEAQA